VPYTSAHAEGWRQGSSVVEGLGAVVAWVDVVLVVVRIVVVGCAATTQRTSSLILHLNWRP